MELKSIASMLWHVVIVNGWSVAWRVGLLSVVFGLLGVLAAIFCYKFFYKAERLKLTVKRERFFENLILGIWIICLPFLGAAAGGLTGGWWAGDFLIRSENLGERLGKAAFKTIATGIAATNMTDADVDQAKYAADLMSGKERLSIEQLHTYSSHHAGELSAEKLRAIMPVSEDGAIHHGTVWMVEKTLDTIAYIELGSEGDIIYKLASKVAAHDRETDNDGYVTVEEISDVACETFLTRGANKLWFALMLELLIPTYLTLLGIVLIPPIFALLVRLTLAWWRKRKAKKEE